jgi:hypothetical protein
MCHIIALTAFTSAEVEERLKSIGLKRIEEKPITALRLCRVVYRHFFRYSLEQSFALTEMHDTTDK